MNIKKDEPKGFIPKCPDYEVIYVHKKKDIIRICISYGHVYIMSAKFRPSCHHRIRGSIVLIARQPLIQEHFAK
jgi:hypothetical protein